MQLHSVTRSFEGPLPHPSVLQQYDGVVPGAAERILRFAEQETDHIHAQEASANYANIAAQQQQIAIVGNHSKSVFRSDAIGQGLGFFVSLCSIAGSVNLALNNQLWVAATVAGLPLAGIIRALRDRPVKK